MEGVSCDQAQAVWALLATMVPSALVGMIVGIAIMKVRAQRRGASRTEGEG